MNETNVDIRSNVYILKSGKPFSDKDFLSKVFEIKALEKMNGKFILNEVQNEIWKRNLPCSVHPNKSRTFGVVKRDGKYFKITKCDFLNKCKYAKRCGCYTVTEIEFIG
jgi:hypothetical protein